MTPDSSATGAYAPQPQPPPGERFAPGAVLADRYRVVARLGKGGMGEVYRADDLALGQPVALKFLPAKPARDPDRLARFRKEVAAARRVSHPHVCRVYDIGDHAGQPFLAMEFVDGEDLSSLLKRVGRLPEEKGVEIARQLCGALAAVHDQGLLHRDLKPANVMLDGRGKVRLTDFGLAVAAGWVQDVRSGTAAYQAPEQRAGREVTARSDLYALGLLLYEVFTGRKAFPGTDRDGPPSKPSSHVSGLSVAVEGVILRCLAADPAERPRSADEVLAGLPGGDPLAAALAAGQTPSPQAVADAPIEGTIHPAVALALLVAVLLGTYGVARLNDATKLFRRVPLQDAAPEVMAHRARELLTGMGYTDPVVGRAAGYAEDRPAGPTAGRPAALYFWYRQSPDPLTNREDVFRPGFYTLPGWVTPTEPATTVPGMTTLAVDLNGRLLEFRAVPPPLPPAGPAGGEPPSWSALFRAAGLDLAGFREDRSPRRTPPAYADRRAAWDGPDPDHPGADLHVEAATFQGRPVYFYRGPADGPDRLARPRGPQPGPGLTVVAVAITTAFSVGAALAWRNVRRGRANLPGVRRLAACLLLLFLLAWGLLATHAPVFFEEAASFKGLLGTAVFSSGLFGLWYLALEPHVRRRWPWVMVSWNRLLEGRWRDPLVGRDVLIGMLVGVAVALLFQIQILLPRWFARPPAFLGIREDLLGHGPAFAVIGLLDALYAGMARFFILCVAIVLVRSVAWGVTLGLLLVSVTILTQGYTIGTRGPSGDMGALAVAALLAAMGVTFAVLLRFGLLAYVAVMVSAVLLTIAPLTTDLSAWYAPSGLAGALVLIGLAVYGFVVSRGGRPLLGKGFLMDD